MRRIKINPEVQDYEQVTFEFQQDLSARSTAWKDVFKSGIGQFILELFAKTVAYFQHGAMRAAQESALPLTQSYSSAIAQMRSLGLYVERVKPASVRVSIKNPTPGVFFTIAPLTRCTINGANYICLEGLTFNANEDVKETDLMQGQVVEERAVSAGGNYQTYFIGSPDFRLSNEYFYAVNQNQVYINTKSPLGLMSETPSFYENTLPNGMVEVRFGSSDYHTVPAFGTEIIFQYLISDGANTPYVGSNESNQGSQVQVASTPATTGITVSQLSGGTNIRPLSYFKLFGPALFRSENNTISNEVSWRASALSYPGVLDAQFFGQSRTKPDDPRYINVIEYTLLTTQPLDSIGVQAFEDYLRRSKKAFWSSLFVYTAPTAVPIDIVIDVHCRARTDLAAKKAALEAKLQAFLAPRAGLLGFPIFSSDFSEQVNQLGDDIEYIRVRSPEFDVVPSALEYVQIGSLTLTMYYTSRNRDL